MTDEEYELTSCIYIRKYINNDTFTDDYIRANHSLAIKRIVMRLKEIDDLPIGILSTKTPEATYTYMDNRNAIMTKDIKDLLPLPYIRLF